MSLTTRDSAATPVAAASAGHYGMTDLVRSEWTKLRTVRSTIWTLGMTILVGLAASGIATAVTRAHWATMSAGDKASFHPAEVSLMGAYLAARFCSASSASWP